MPLDERLESLLLQAEELRLQGQPVSPEQLCGHCPELVPEVRRLLGKLDQVDNLLHVPALAAATPLRLSGYRIRQELGRGGMGVVYDAEQQALGRRVALKVLPALPGQDPERVARFQREVRAAARLQHPNIVPVYEVGQEEGVWFYAMQFIPGRPVSDLISALRRRRDGKASPEAEPAAGASTAAGEAEGSAPDAAPRTMPPRPAAPGTNACTTPSPGAATTTSVVNGLGQLSPDTDPRRYFREVARLGQQVAEALACAHARGVLHRDVKPANLLVDETGRVWVTDFGLAKVEEDEALTQSGAMLGTLRYMAPEQMRGAPEARSDIYSVGLTLYELLVLQPAFDAVEYLQLLELVAHHEPQRPRSLDARIPCDLETIVLKAIEKDPNRRYRTAQELADDLHRFLMGEPIRARPTPVWERAVKWVRRRPTAAVLVGFALLAVATLLTLGVNHQLRAARVAAEAGKELEQGVGLRQEARKLSGKQALALAAKARGHAQRAQALVENGPANAALAAQAQRLLAHLDADDADRQLQADLEAASLPQGLLDDRETSFAKERAVPLFRKALAKYGLPVGKGEPAAAARRLRACPAEVRETVLAALNEWIHHARAARAGVEKPHLAWLRAMRAALDPVELGRDVLAAEKDPARLRGALETLAARVDVQRVPWYALQQLVNRLSEAGAPEKAVVLLRRAQVRRAGDFWVNMALGLALQELSPPDRAGAIRYLTAAVAVRPDLAGAHLNLANALRRLEPAQAEGHYRRALELGPDFAIAHVNFGLALHLSGRWDEGLAEVRRGLKLSPEDPGIHANLAEVLRGMGRFEEAEAAARQAIRLDRNYLGGYLNLALALTDQAKPAAALAELRRAIPLARKLPQDRAHLHATRAYALHKQGKLREAVAELRTAVAHDPGYAQAHALLGAGLLDLKQFDEAAAACRQALRLNPAEVSAHHNLGIILRAQGKLDQALAAYAEAIKLTPHQARNHLGRAVVLSELGKDDEALSACRTAARLNPMDAEIYGTVGAILARQHRTEEALATLRKALDLGPSSATTYANLGETLRRAGKYEDALKALHKALALDPKHAPAQASIASVLGLQGKPVEAIAAYRQALVLDPKLAPAHYDLGNLLRGRGAEEEAIACFRKAIALDPRHAASYNNLGNLLLNRGELDEAEAAFRKAIELEPKLGVPHTGLGNLLLKRGRRDEAVAEYRKASALAPKHAGVHASLAGALEAQGKNDEALAAYRQALALDDRCAKAHAGLGELLRKAGKVGEALPHLRKAVALDSNNPRWHTNLGAALAAQGQQDEALAAFRRALELDPKLFEAHNNLAAVLGAQGKVAESLVAIRQAIAADPKDARGHSNLGRVFAWQRKFAEASAAFREAADLDPKTAAYPFELGMALRAQGKTEEAIAAYRRAIELDPKHLSAHGNLGDLLLARGRVEQAVAEYRKTIELAPSLPAAHSNLGNALGAQGKLPEAAAAHRRALALDPSNARVHSNLANVLRVQGLLNEALSSYRKAVVLDPKLSVAHWGQGMVLQAQGQLPEAATAYRQALALAPNDAEGHRTLGQVLLEQGQFAEARASASRALKLLPMGHRARPAAALLLQTSERHLELEKKLPALLAGKASPANHGERLEYALICQLTKRPAAAVRLYADAFAAGPAPPDGLSVSVHYLAARAAARAASGRGEDAAGLPEKERARYRKQALAWLRDALAACARLMKSGKAQERHRARQDLERWRVDADLAGIRDHKAVAELPEAEREGCARFWRDVEALLR
jgi:tetratricopeptide (TPR) repeat protein/serine/threonine protein kinase